VDADAVKRAPQVDDDRELTPADELELARHYALGPSGAASGQQEAAAGQQEAAAGQEEAAAPPGPAPAADPGQPTLTRSEEQVRVDTATVPTSRAVLRTTRVVEERTFSVPLGRDQVQVVYEPLPDAGPGPVRAQSPDAPPQDGPGPEGDDDDWVVLYEERLVVRTEWVPVERVRLRTAGVRGEEVVHVDLRRERVDVDVEPTGQAPGGEPDEARP
jgi:stress response protein YsnF